MTRIRLSVTAVAMTSLGLLFAPACSSDDTSVVSGEGGSADTPTTNVGGNKPQTGGTTARGGATGNGGAVTNGGTTATGGGAATGGKASTGGGSGGGGAGVPATGGRTNIAGNPGVAGTAGTTPATSGTANAGTAGQGTSPTGTGGVSAAGSTSTGGVNTAGTKNAAGSAGKPNQNTAGTAGTWTAGDCPTSNTSLAKFCAPQDTIVLPNIPPGVTLNGLSVSTSNGVLTLSGTVPSDGWTYSNLPFNDAACTNAGIDATGKAGVTLTVKNNLSSPARVTLLVTDQAGTAAPYSLVDLSVTREIAGSSISTVNLPFTSLVPACTLPTGVSLNYATITNVGFELGTPGAVNISLSNIKFYSN